MNASLTLCEMLQAQRYKHCFPLFCFLPADSLEPITDPMATKYLHNLHVYTRQTVIFNYFSESTLFELMVALSLHVGGPLPTRISP